MTRIGILVLAGIVGAGTAAAQPGGARPGGAQPGRGAPRDEAFRMIDAYLLSNLQESLGLGDEQYVKLLPLVKKQQSDRREGAQRRMRALMELRRALQSGRATEASILELLEEVKQAESEGPALAERNQQAIDALLKPLQQAKYRVLEAEVERKMRELLRSAVRGRAMERRERRSPGRASDPEPSPND